MAQAVTDGGPKVGVVVKPTKRSDWRDVPLTTRAFAALRAQAHRQRLTLGREPDGTAFVFSADVDGKSPLRPDSFSDRWAVARGKSAITIQHLRHYAATSMLDAGESYRTVAEILGNSENTLRLHYDGRTHVGKRGAIAALEL